MDQRQEDPNRRGRFRTSRVVQASLSIIVVVVIFAFAFPKLADYSKVWAEIRDMTWVELASLGLVSIWNIITYWFVMVASLPGSNYWQAMKVNQASTAIANTLPGGGALGIAVTYGMYSSYGFAKSQIALSILVSGIWNNFVKLGMPILALAFVAFQGNAGTGPITASLVGVAVLVGAVVVFALVLRSEELARKVGDKLGLVASFVRRLFRKPAVNAMREAVARFRRDAIGLLRKRWAWLTLATVVSHVSLYLVLLLTLRHVGVSNSEVGWAEVLAAFAFVRLISALPITPGGLGVVELGLTAALISAGGDSAEVAASVLVYRALTYLPPILLGAILYLRWRQGAEARALRVAEWREAAPVPLEEPPISGTSVPVPDNR
jgi:uncharacterized protein (TIRG00374 family)